MLAADRKLGPLANNTSKRNRLPGKPKKQRQTTKTPVTRRRDKSQQRRGAANYPQSAIFQPLGPMNPPRSPRCCSGFSIFPRVAAAQRGKLNLGSRGWPVQRERGEKDARARAPAASPASQAPAGGDMTPPSRELARAG